MAYYDRVPFTPASSLGYLVRRIHQQQVAALEPMFAEEGITMTQWSSLVSIALARATTCADLARDLAHDKGAMTRLLDQLEERGLVTRERGADDRRYVHLAITEAGRELTERCRARVTACWNRWLEAVPVEEVDQMLATLRHVSTVLETVPAEAA